MAIAASQGNVFTITLTDSGWTIASPANPIADGQLIRIRLIQDSTGGRTVSWAATGYDWGSTSGTPNTPPVLSTTPADGKLHYAEGIHIGYRAWLRREGIPAYWFGAGLGYTDIAVAGVSAPASAAAGETFAVTVEVANRGERDGKQVVQVYAERPDSAVDRPVRWLVGFAPVRVPAGGTAQVRVSVPTRLLAYWEDGWRYEPGRYRLRVGTSAVDLPLTAEMELI